jgi:NarL family two-component system response regulator LiaR
MPEWGLFQQHSSSEALQLLAEHHSAKEMASILNISARTVDFHKYRTMDDLEFKSAAELIRFAAKHGIASQ